MFLCLPQRPQRKRWLNDGIAWAGKGNGQDRDMTAQSSQSRPLEGVVIVELGDSASAPYAGYILASLGATVWKVERPDVGDASRSWGADRWKGSGSIFHALNRGKKSIALNIKDSGDLAALKDLIVNRADVFLHNLRPGTIHRFGLDEASLMKAKPSLIHCTVGAFGSKGAMNTLPGFDPLLQAFSGIMSLTGEAGQAPVRAGVSLVDFGTGLWAAFGIMTSLYARKNTARGQVVESSLFETALGWMTAAISTFQVTQECPQPMGSGIAFIAPYKAYLARDGYLVIACGNDRLFAKLCAVFGTEAWLEDARFATNSSRVQNRDAIDQLVGDQLVTRSRAEWRDLFDAAGVPCAPIQTTDEVVAHPQTEALGMLSAAPDDELRLVGIPFSLDGIRPGITHGAPLLGADNAEFRMLGKQAFPHSET